MTWKCRNKEKTCPEKFVWKNAEYGNESQKQRKKIFNIKFLKLNIKNS